MKTNNNKSVSVTVVIGALMQYKPSAFNDTNMCRTETVYCNTDNAQLTVCIGDKTSISFLEKATDG